MAPRLSRTGEAGRGMEVAVPSLCVLEMVAHPAIADIVVVSLIAVIAVIESFFKKSVIAFRL